MNCSLGDAILNASNLEKQNEKNGVIRDGYRHFFLPDLVTGPKKNQVKKLLCTRSKLNVVTQS
jgi:hypothetical protein